MSSKFNTWFRGQRLTLDADHLPVLTALQGAIWFHAASVGEFEQARPIIERIKDRCAVGPLHCKTASAVRPIVVTFFSPSGYEARKGYELADGVFYLPLPTRRNARKFLDALQPSLAIFVKYEFWPAYLKELKKRDIPTYSICSIFRPNQVFFKWWGRVYRKSLRCFTHLFVQDEASRVLLAQYGITQASVAGDTRIDRVKQIADAIRPSQSDYKTADAVRPPLADRLSPIVDFARGCERMIVAGSTWPKDEVLLKQFVERVNELTNERIKLILVPHELDEKHLHFIFNLFQGRYVRYSRATQASLIHAQVMVVDTMGLLSSIYRFGQVAYIGGGFGVGIHNTIEAAAYGMPVIFGPNYEHFREAQDLIKVGAARSIKTYSELEAALDTALDNHETIGAKAAAYVASELGATDKIFVKIFV